MFFDTHCHLSDSKFKEDLDQVLDRCAAEDVNYLALIGTGLDDIQRAAEIIPAVAERGITPVLAGGLTPFDVAGASSDDIDLLGKLLKEHNASALGEIGLDRLRSYTPEEKEEEFLVRQIELSHRLELPVIFHCREAHERLREIIREQRDQIGKAVVHCFSGTYRDAVDYLDMGFLLSFTCIAGYKNADREREVIKKIPLEAILAETDAPYLPPADKRGTRNEPANVKRVIELISEVKKESLVKTSEQIYMNSAGFFGINI